MTWSAHAATPKFVDATAADNFKVYWLVKADQPPQIDGNLDDAVWQQADPLVDWGTTNYGRQRARLGEKFRLGEIDFRAAWDDSFLYIAARCYHRGHPNDMNELRRKVSDLSAAIYARECMEIHIDGNLDHATRFQSILNPLGEKMMIWHYDFGWGLLTNPDYGLDADWDVAAQIKDDHWTFEARYALADIQVEPKVGEMFGINPCWFNWADSLGDGEKYWWQYVTWSTHGDSHHDPRLYGRFILVEEKPKTLKEGLRLAYPDLDQRSIMIQTAEGFLVLDHGESRMVTYEAQVKQEAAAAKEALARLKTLLSDNKTLHSGHAETTILPEQEKLVTDAAAQLDGDNELSRGQLAQIRRTLADAKAQLDDWYWRVKTDVLLSSLNGQ